MAGMRQILVVLSAVLFVFPRSARSQDDSPSLGDVARQARLQKQKEAQAGKEAVMPGTPKNEPGAARNVLPKEGQASRRVITNDDIPERAAPPRAPASNPVYPQPRYDGRPSAESWKSQIEAVKNTIAAMETNIKTLSESIQFSGSNCLPNCVQWNLRQKQAQDEVQALNLQLAQQRKYLELMQETARRQGYGSSVYDP